MLLKQLATKFKGWEFEKINHSSAFRELLEDDVGGYAVFEARIFRGCLSFSSSCD